MVFTDRARLMTGDCRFSPLVLIKAWHIWFDTHLIISSLKAFSSYLILTKLGMITCVNIFSLASCTSTERLSNKA